MIVIKHWNKLPRELLEFLSGKILKTQLDRVQDNLLKAAPAGAGTSFQPKWLCNTVNKVKKSKSTEAT